MNPAMIMVWITGPMIAYGFSEWQAPWLHAKLVLVVAMSGFHGYLSKLTKDFAADANTHSAKFYRIMNEVPTVLMILIVILVIVKPF